MSEYYDRALMRTVKLREVMGRYYDEMFDEYEVDRYTNEAKRKQPAKDAFK